MVSLTPKQRERADRLIAEVTRKPPASSEREVWAYYNGLGRTMCLFLFGCLLVLVAFGLRWLAYQ
jgi:hypothetical protein